MVVSRCRGIGPPSSGIVLGTLFLLAADLRRYFVGVLGIPLPALLSNIYIYIGISSMEGPQLDGEGVSSPSATRLGSSRWPTWAASKLARLNREDRRRVARRHARYLLAFTRYSFTYRLLRTNQPSFHSRRLPALPTLVQYYYTIIGQYNTTPLPTSRLYAIHHTILVITILCKGQGTSDGGGRRAGDELWLRRDMGARAIQAPGSRCSVDDERAKRWYFYQLRHSSSKRLDDKWRNW